MRLTALGMLHGIFSANQMHRCLLIGGCSLGAGWTGGYSVYMKAVMSYVVDIIWLVDLIA